MLRPSGNAHSSTVLLGLITGLGTFTRRIDEAQPAVA